VYDTVQFNVVNRSVLAGRTFELVDIEDNWDGTFLTSVGGDSPADVGARSRQVHAGHAGHAGRHLVSVESPAAVTNFAVAAITPQTLPDGTAVSQVSLTWDAIAGRGNTPAARIELRYRLAGGDWIGIASVPGDSTASTMTAALVDGEVYQFQARYVNGVGAASAWVDAWTQIAGHAAAGAALAASACVLDDLPRAADRQRRADRHQPRRRAHDRAHEPACRS
jgi:hypothetical protein